MKRIVALMLVLTLGLAALPALAAGNIKLTDDVAQYVVPRSKDFRVYYYAVVKNEGDAPARVNDLLFEVRDMADDTIESTSKYALYPEILAPGQSGWLVISQDVKDVKDKAYIDHFNLTITSKAPDDDEELRRLSASAEYIAKDEDDNEDVLRASVTNDGGENAFKITVAVAARDAEGKLLYVAGDTAKNIGLAPGGAMLTRAFIRSDIVDEIEEANATVAKVEAIAYRIVDTDD